MTFHYEFDIAAVVLYLILVLLYLCRPHVKDNLHKIYIYLFTCATVTPVFDILSCYGINHSLNNVFVNIITSLYYLSFQGVTFFFLFYIIYHLQFYKEIPKIQRIFAKIPIGLMIIFILTNPITGFIFKYSSENGYESGKLQWLFFAIVELYFVITFIYITRNRKAYERKVLFTIFNIFVVNLFFIILQYIFYYYMLLSFGFAVSMVLLSLTAHTTNSGIDIETKLMKREYFYSLSENLIHKKSPFSVIFIRITDYDILSELYGEKTTSGLVKKVAKKLSHYVEVGEGFQLNFNSFALLIQNKEKVTSIQKELIENIDNLCVTGTQQIPLSVIITTIEYPQTAADMPELITYLQFFEKTKKIHHGIIPASEFDIKKLSREMEVEQAIRKGLENKNLSVYYQPMCTAKDKNFMTAEALLRLNDPDLGCISPEEFIPIAEHSGLMVTLGNYVLNEVCRFISENDMKKLGLEYIEVNLSVIQVLQNNFIESITDAINKYGINKKYLCFEITETAANCSPDLFKTNLLNLIDHGFELALDDFGSGYGNLQRLMDTKFSIIKFDKNMIQQTCASEELKNAFPTLISMFHKLHYRVVAEGVETQEQYDFMNDSKVDYIQGYYFSRPVPESDFKIYMETHKN